MLWQFNEMALLAAVLGGFLVAIEAGFRQGLRHADRSDGFAKAHVESLRTAVLGLLALLLGFTFFMAASRFDERKSLVLEEANAIGTAYLRSQLLSPEQRKTAAELFRAHLAARLAFSAAGIETLRLDKANSEAAQTERQLWALALSASAQEPRSVPIGLFVESLNAIVDLHEKRQVAFENHVPEAVNYLLLAVSLVSFGLLGYDSGLTRSRRLGSNTLFAVLIVFVLVMILDIDRPRSGFITVPQESLLRLQAALARDVL